MRTSPAEATVETEARVIVKYKVDSTLMRALSGARELALPQYAQAMSGRLGIALTDGRIVGVRMQVLKAKGLSSRELADRIAAQEGVEYAVVDGRKRAFAVPNDPLYPDAQTTATPASGQWYLRPPTGSVIVDATSIVASIDAQTAWGITTGSPSLVVADIDTGIRPDHPDFAAKLVAGYDFITDPAANNDNGLGRNADDSDPGDFVTQADVNAMPDVCSTSDIGPSSWHGTQTAGLIGAATNNSIGMASVGFNVMLQPLRVLGKCGGADSDILAAMQWAVGIAVPGVVPTVNPTPAKVLNLSLGAATACDAAYQDVVTQVIAAGAVIVAAAGNAGLAIGSPANCTGVIAVVGVRHAGTKVGYSDLGPNAAISAPAGNCVNTSGACLFPLLTTSNSGTEAPVAGPAGAIYTDGESDPSLGTSFSSPLVAGTAALILSANPALTPSQVRSALQSTARAFPSAGAGTGVAACLAPSAIAQNAECYCTTSTCGAGLLDAGAATTAAAAVHASVVPSAASVMVGGSISLDGTGSWPSGGASAIATYQWAITGGAGLASLSGSTGPVVTLVASAAGAVTVTLTVTDTAGKQASNSAAISVTVPSTATSTPVSSSGSGGGGGGALTLGWLVGWLLAVVAVWAATPRQRPG